MLSDVAKKEVSTWLLKRLETECPGGKATKDSITACVATACGDLGFEPDTIKVNIENGRAYFVVSPMNAIMMASKIGAPNG